MTSDPRVSVAPRRMLPPPTTMASWTPWAATREAWLAIRLTSSTLIPPSPGRQKLSPESLSKTRRKSGGPEGETASMGGVLMTLKGNRGAEAGRRVPGLGPTSLGGGWEALADEEPGEPRDRDVLSCPGVDGLDHVADRLGLVLDESLLHQ